VPGRGVDSDGIRACCTDGSVTGAGTHPGGAHLLSVWWSVRILLLSNISSQRSAQQLFPFIFLPQFFLAGVFSPIKELPWYLEILSRISPLRYAVDLVRSVFYIDSPDKEKVVLTGFASNMLIISIAFTVAMIAGTWLFVRAERNR